MRVPSAVPSAIPPALPFSPIYILFTKYNEFSRMRGKDHCAYTTAAFKYLIKKEKREKRRKKDNSRTPVSHSLAIIVKANTTNRTIWRNRLLSVYRASIWRWISWIVTVRWCGHLQTDRGTGRSNLNYVWIQTRPDCGAGYGGTKYAATEFFRGGNKERDALRSRGFLPKIHCLNKKKKGK